MVDEKISDVEAPIIIAFIGAIFIILDAVNLIQGFALNPTFTTPLYLVFGIIDIVIAVVVIISLELIEINVDLSVLYTWYILIGLGVTSLILNMIAWGVQWNAVFGMTIYRGGLFVLIAGLILFLNEVLNKDWEASKLVILIGSVVTIAAFIGSTINIGITTLVPSIFTANVIYWNIVSIILAAILILMVFNFLIPNKWYITLSLGLVIFILGHPVGGLVILVGFVLQQLDK